MVVEYLFEMENVIKDKMKELGEGGMKEEEKKEGVKVKGLCGYKEKRMGIEGKKEEEKKE